jgi:hypothetical protein
MWIAREGIAEEAGAEYGFVRFGPFVGCGRGL